MPVLDNPKHEQFAQELAKGKTQVEAYELAGYKANEGNASTLASNPEVQGRVKEIKSVGAEKAAVTVQRVMEELAKIGFSNMLDYVSINSDGDPHIDLSRMDREQAAAVQEITVQTRTEKGGENRPDAEVKQVRFKLSDKRAALVDLGKHLGMFTERIEHTGKIETTAPDIHKLTKVIAGLLYETHLAKAKASD
jgi:phage terminase small subunit